MSLPKSNNNTSKYTALNLTRVIIGLLAISWSQIATLETWLYLLVVSIGITVSVFGFFRLAQLLLKKSNT